MPFVREMSVERLQCLDERRSFASALLGQAMLDAKGACVWATHMREQVFRMRTNLPRSAEQARAARVKALKN